MVWIGLQLQIYFWNVDDQMTSIDSMLTKIWIGDLLTKKIQNDAVIEP